MAGYGSMKMKRKDLDEVSDDFSDFSLSSPAKKIRRLDVELPPIIEEEEPEIPLAFQQSGGGGAPAMEESLTVPPNEEMAIVVFNPMNATPFLQSPSNFCVFVDSDIVSGFKNFWSGHSSSFGPAEGEESTHNKNSMTSQENLAVVPWVPSQFPQAPSVERAGADESGPMEAEDMEAATMEIESDNNSAGLGQPSEFSGLRQCEGFPHWQQQHCLTPQLPQTTSTPIVWYR